MRSLRIAVADDERDMRDFFCRILPLLGHDVVLAAATGAELVEGCRQARPDLVISDVRMPDMDGLQAAAALSREEPLPLILVSGFHDKELVDRAAENHVLAYLVKPIGQADLEAAIVIALRRFEEFRAVQQEAAQLRQCLEDRKLIERAKGILMKQTGLDEAAAFRRMQKLAAEKNRKLAEIAQAILVADEACRGE